MHDTVADDRQASFVVVDRLTVEYQSGGEARTAAVENLSLTVRKNEFLAIVGPSGCGKSTLIHALAGFISPVRGTAIVAGAEIQGPSPDRGVLFQRLGLFPWATVAGNVRFGLEMRGHAAADSRDLVTSLLQEVGLESFADFYPAQLSGGMAQRVAIARVLAPTPQVLLLDEPFVALDAQTRDEMHQLLLRLHERKPMTIILVTHDVEEAVFLADRVVVLSARPAHVVQNYVIDLGRPRERDVVMDERFVTSRLHISEALREEVLRARLQSRARTLGAKGLPLIRVGSVPTAEAAPLIRLRDSRPTSKLLYEFFEYDSGPAIARMLANDECDIALLGACPVLAALHQAAPLMIVRDGGYATKNLVAGLVATPTVAALTREELADLPIGINGRGTNAEYLTREFFRDSQKEARFIAKPFEQLVRELESRRLQVAALYAPYLQRAVTGLGCTLIFDFSELVSPLQLSVLVARRQMPDKLLRAFLKQWDAAVHAIVNSDHRDDVGAMVSWSDANLLDRLSALDQAVVAPAFPNTLDLRDYADATLARQQ